MDDDNLKKFLNYLDRLPNTYKNFYDTVLYKTLLATGLRIRECLALKWSDIDLQNGTLDVNKTLNCEKEVTTPKTKSSVRMIDLDNKTVLMLRLYKNRQAQVGREIGLTYKKVFSNSFDEYRDARALRSRLEKHLKLSECPRLTFHAFRHTHASILLNAGLPYKEIQTRLGHSQISITMDTYSHLSKDNKKNATSFYEKAIEKLKSS
ncbi:site-specific integrase [Streptococcus pseudopneumoniae]|uniref:Site-specific integrase n=1 Tax=Streptococcus pseudopneumoniae TaxID=257758 RepID=A0ABX9P6R3_9STRE|nr:site-specific integrase [Streptococcus pseudopneumoniae]RJY07165.1 site-specific integrase [Streptococcus pseudopneumoniae]